MNYEEIRRIVGRLENDLMILLSLENDNILKVVKVEVEVKVVLDTNHASTNQK